MPPSISVVIGTYNQKDQLKFTLESLFHQSISPDYYELVIVDSFSVDGTDAMIESLSPSPCPLNYIRQENKGKAAARNMGIKEAKGKIILLTDADMIADKHLIEEHYKAHQKHKNACFEGLTYNLKSKIQDTRFQANPKFQIPVDQTEPYIKEKLRPGQKLKWAYFLSGNLSVKKETLSKVGLFDEDFTAYGWEDLELGYRLHKKRVPLYYLSSAINYHNHFVQADDMLKRKYNMGKSAALFYKKHPNFEIKMFLGMNPIAMGVYRYLRNNPEKLEGIIAKSRDSNFFRYILEEYYYRQGLEEAFS